MTAREASWIMVRVKRTDHAKLSAFAKRLKAWANDHPNELPPWCEDEEFSLSAAIRLLLYRQDMKDQRARTANRNRRSK